MHELAIAKGIIDIVNSEAREKGFRKVLEIKLSIGEYSGIIPDCLREFFPYAAAGTPFEAFDIEIPAGISMSKASKLNKRQGAYASA